MARLSSELVLTLRDGVSGPARRAGGALDGLERKARAHVRMTSAISRASEGALSGMASALTPAALAFGAQQSFVRFAAAERTLNRIGVTAGASAQEIKNARREIDQMSYTYAMGQDQVTAGLDSLVAAGRSMKDAMAFLPSVVATAQASGAEVSDIATTADAVGTGFDIAADKMQNAFDILVTGGKLGKFELKDMARYLPSMVPAFEALGYKGEAGLKKLTAALQVVRAGTGSSEEAATSLANVIQKMESDETVKNFKDFGIDLRGSLAAARRNGKDVLDTFIRLSAVATKGDMSKIPQLFADAQMQSGMRALLNGTPLLAKYFRELGSAAGSTQKDVAQVLSDNQTKLDRLSSSWDRFVKTVGGGIAPTVSSGLDAVTSPVQQALDEQSGNERLAAAGVDEKKARARHAELWQELHGKRFWGENSADIVGDYKRAKAAYGRGDTDDLLTGLRKSLAGPRTKDDYVQPGSLGDASDGRSRRGGIPTPTARPSDVSGPVDLADGQPLRRGIPTPTARPSEVTAAASPEAVATTGLKEELEARDKRIAAGIKAEEDAMAARIARNRDAQVRMMQGLTPSNPEAEARRRAFNQSQDASRRQGNLAEAAELRTLIDGLRSQIGLEQRRKDASGGFAPVIDSRIDQLNNRIADLTAKIGRLQGADIRESRTKDDAVAPAGSDGRDALAGITARFDAAPTIAETERAAQAAEAAGNRMTSALNVTAAPQIDTSPLDTLNQKIATAVNGLRDLGAQTAAAAQRAINRLPGTTFDDAPANIEN